MSCYNQPTRKILIMRSLNQLDPKSSIWQQKQTTFTQKRAESLEISPAPVVFAHWQWPCWSPETPPKLGRCSCGPPPEGWLVMAAGNTSAIIYIHIMIIYNDHEPYIYIYYNHIILIICSCKITTHLCLSGWLTHIHRTKTIPLIGWIPLHTPYQHGMGN